MVSQDDREQFITRRVAGQGSTFTSSFGPFLEQITSANSVTGPRDLESRVVQLLAEHGALDMAELIRETRAPLASLLQSLQHLRDFGLISTEGGAAVERFSLSPSGARTAESLSTS